MFIVGMVAVVGLCYGAFWFWTKSDRTASTVRSIAGESVLIPVEGMSCSVCAGRVRKTLKEIAGVSEVQVSLERHEAEIRYEPEKTSPQKLAKAIDDLGYKAGTPKPKVQPQ